MSRSVEARRKILQVVLFVGLVLALDVLVGCRTCPPVIRPAGGACLSDVECGKPLSCIPRTKQEATGDRYCLKTCRSDAECGVQACLDGTCTTPSTSDTYSMAVHVDRPAPVEIAPWIEAGGGPLVNGGTVQTAFSFGAGAEVTLPFHPWKKICPVATLCPRLGPWVAVQDSFKRANGEGGLALEFAGTEAFSLSTFAARLGAGLPAAGPAYFDGQISWGTRFVAMRSPQDECHALIAPVSGIRIFADVRKEVSGQERLQVTFGVQWQPVGRGFGIIAR